MNIEREVKNMKEIKMELNKYQIKELRKEYVERVKEWEYWEKKRENNNIKAIEKYIEDSYQRALGKMNEFEYLMTILELNTLELFGDIRF